MDFELSPTARSSAERLEGMLGSGMFDGDGKLPSERVLARQLGVSRTTLRLSLGALSERGLVTASPQSGWFVAGARLGEPPRTLISFSEMALRRGVVPRTKVLSHVLRDATLDEAQKLAVAPLSRVVEVERLRLLGTAPACIDHSVILLERTTGIESVDLENCSLYEQMRSRGTEPSRSTFAIEAIGANRREADLLEVSVGSPLLLGVETCFDAVGSPLLLGDTRYRANVYRFYSTMSRR